MLKYFVNRIFCQSTGTIVNQSSQSLRSLDRLSSLTENSPWFIYSTTIKSNLSVQIMILSHENYIQILLSCTLNTGTKIKGNNHQ